MKYLIIATICFVSINLSAQKVFLSGTILNFHNQMQVEDLSEIKELSLPNLERTFIPDSAGKFSVSFPLAAPNYFRIGRNILYLSPGDTLSVTLDYMAPEKAHFAGNSSASIAANQYLESTPFPKGGSFLNAGDHIKNSIQATIDTVFVIASERKKTLDSYQHLTKEFYRNEEVRIHADLANSLWHIPTYFLWKYPVKKESIPDFMDSVQKITTSYIIEQLSDYVDPTYLKLVVFRDMIADNQKTIPEIKKNRKIQEFIRASELFDMLQDLDNKQEILALKPAIDSIQTLDYRSALINTYDKKLGLTNGDQAKDLKLTNRAGKQVKLSSFKGKVLYIDIWATWCGPCVEELPHLDSLRKKFATNKNIEFISLSIEDDKLKWKNYIAANKLSGTQMIIDRSLLNDYNVITIPRVIIIDKDFKVAAMYGGLPSKQKTVEFLNQLNQNGITR